MQGLSGEEMNKTICQDCGKDYTNEFNTFDSEVSSTLLCHVCQMKQRKK